MRGSRENGRGATPRPGVLRRLSRRRDPLPRSDSERLAAAAAGADMSVEDVLREVADFRLALETDMIIAAAAVDADTPELLSEVLDDERAELVTFHDRLLSRLADAAAEDEVALRRSRKAAVASGAGRISQFVAAAAAVGALVVGAGTIAGPQARETTNAAAMNSANQHYADFSSAVTSDSPAAVRRAADKLHTAIEELINEHASDPEVAQRAAQLLQAEISLLSVTDPVGASHVLAQARSLVTMLEKAAPTQVRASLKPVLDAAVSPKPKPKPKPSASPTPKATPTASPSASASADPDDDSPLP